MEHMAQFLYKKKKSQIQQGNGQKRKAITRIGLKNTNKRCKSVSDIYARINLSKINYRMSKSAVLFNNPPVDQIQEIYDQYCKYKQFESVMPIFNEDLCAPHCDIIGYYSNKELVAFSHYYWYNSDNVEAIQFAWNYKNPKLFLGLKSLRHECAYYKAKGVKYIYVGYADEYKKQINGFEICPPR